MGYNLEDLEELEQAMESTVGTVYDPIILQELENIKARLENIQNILDEMSLDIEDLAELN
jgi:hypothetical protein